MINEMEIKNAVAINLFTLAVPVSSLGPGDRIVIWVAGCKRHCRGCMSPEMRDPASGRLIPVQRMVRYVLDLPGELAGLTISGGEPFDQAEGLAEFLYGVRQEHPDWEVIVYSGYTLKRLRADATKKRLLTLVDILIDGEFRQDAHRNHPLAGSGNQRVIALSQRGKAMKTIMNTMPFNQVNLGIGQMSTTMIIGVTDEMTRAPLRQFLQ